MQDEDEAWIKHREQFSAVYDESNYSSTAQSRVMRASHKMIEKIYDSNFHFSQVLEIGAGTGEHLRFVRHSFDRYILSDHDPNTLEVARKKINPVYESKVTFHAQAGSGLEYEANTFDRLIATHVLEHIYEPHLALKEWRRVLKDGGVLSILIPTDPGIAWRLGRHLGPRRKALARGLAYDYIMAREHVNPCNNLVALLRHYFPNAKESWWPFLIPSIDANLFFCFHATVRKK